MRLIDEWTRAQLRVEWERKQDYDAVFGPGAWDRRCEAKKSGVIAVFDEVNLNRTWKIAITTKCGAKCITCPCHLLSVHRTMSVEMFGRVMDWIESQSDGQDFVQINSVGDVLCLPNAKEYLDRVARCPLMTVLTTNGAFLREMPPVGTLIISFNGGTLWAHHRVTGLDSEKVLENIRRLYPQMVNRRVEIHCLIGDFNSGTEKELLRLFDGFPGRIRVSYKCENQGGKDHTLDRYRKGVRIPCDYLDAVVIDPSGKIIQCSHDFEAITDFGQVGMADVIWNENRVRVRVGHEVGKYCGLCEFCNYNVPLVDQVVYVKG